MKRFLFSMVCVIVGALTIKSLAQTCKTPENLRVTGLSQTEATLIWDLSADGDVPSSYFVRVMVGDSVVLVDSNRVAQAQFINLSGLRESTWYSVELSANCNITQSGISETVTMEFETPCAAINAPYVERMDNGTPECGVTKNAEWRTGGRTGGCIALTTTASEAAYVVMRGVTTRSDSVEMEVWMKTNTTAGGGVPFYIGIVTDIADIEGSFEPLWAGVTEGTEWTEVRMNTSGTQAEVTERTVMAVVVPQGGSFTVMVDDVAIREIPTCIRPEDFRATSVTDSSVTLSWTQTNAEEVEISVRSGSETRSVRGTGNPWTVTGLEPDTEYEFGVRGWCSSTDWSEWSPTTVAVRTECVTASEAEMAEGFESLTTVDALPNCWKECWWNRPEGNGRSFAFAVTEERAHSGSRAMSLPQQAEGSRACLTTQAVPIDSGGKYSLSVWVFRQEASTVRGEGLRFWSSAVPNDTTGAELLGFVPRHYQAAPAEFVPNVWYNYEFVINETGDRYILIEGVSENGGSVLIDDVEIRRTPKCRRVSGVQVGTPGSDSISIRFTPGGEEQLWEVKYALDPSTGSGQVPQWVTDTVNVPRLTVRGLTGGVSYTMDGEVTALCSEGERAEAVPFGCTFVTVCEPMDVLPYVCGFESSELITSTSSGQAMPRCWSRWNDAGDANGVYPQAAVAGGDARTGNGVLRFMPRTGGTDYGECQLAVMPRVNSEVYDINDLRLVMYAQATTINPAPMITVGVMTDPTDRGTFVATDSFFVGTTGYLRYEARFGSYAGSGEYVAFYTKRVQSQFLTLNVDDVRLEVVPACGDLDGAGVTVSDLTDNGATLTVSDLNATTWEYAWGVVGTPIEACTTDTVNGLSRRLNGLAPNTHYVVYARRRCGDEQGAWSDPVTFRTACGAMNVPFADDFEDEPAGELTGCYYVVADNQYLAVFDGDGSVYNHTAGGSKGLSASYDARNPGQATLGQSMTVAAYVELTAGHNYEVSIFAKSRNNSYVLSFVYGMQSSVLNIAETQTVSQSSWREMKTYFSPMTSGSYYVGVVTSAVDDHTAYAPYLDDIMIREVSCVPPVSSVVSHLGQDEATVNFVSSGTEWEVMVSQGQNEVYRDTIDSTQFALVGLTPNTTYDYRIRTICSNSNVSDWTTTESFHTRCVTVTPPYVEGFEGAEAVGCWQPLNGEGSVTRETAVKNQGSAAMRIEAASAVSPEFDVVGLADYMLTGWAFSSSDSVSVSIGVMTDPDDASTFESLEDVMLNNANEWTEFTIYFTLLNDPEYADYVDARYVVIATGNGTVWFDDLNLVEVPACNRPAQGVVEAVTDVSVTVDWTESGSAAEWELSITTGNAARTEIVTQHPYTITGLTPSTNYSFYVRSICGVGDTSIWLKIGDAVTECGYMIAPWTEDFERFEVGQTPACWDISASDQTITFTNHPDYLWGVYQSRGNKSIRMYDVMSSTGDVIIITPEIVLPEGANYDFRYDYCHQSTTADLVVGVRRHGKTMFTTIATHPNNGMTDAATPQAFQTGSYGLKAYVGDTVQFMFFGQTHYNPGATWVDNVRVRRLSDCSEVSAVSVQSMTPTTMDIAFADTAASHSAWQYVVVRSGGDVESATPVDVTAKAFSVTGLEPAATYDVAVRAVCAAGDYSSWVTVTEKTPATAATLPYITRFDNEQQNEEWMLLGNGANGFTFGRDADAAFENGGAAMYVTDGNGYGYNFGSSSITGVARLFDFDETTYTIEFDWKCSGGQYSFDYTRFFLAPAYADLLPTYTTSQVYRYYSWPDNLIPLDGDTCRSMVEGGTQHVSEIIDMTGRSGEYYLVYIWVNDGSGGNNYPLSVGNLSVAELTCEPLVNLSIDANSISHNSITATWNNPNVGSDVRWAVSTTALVGDTVASGVTQGGTVTINGLQPSTRYHLFVRAECSQLDCSPWISIPFQTECAAVNSFPLTESFEDLNFPPVCWTMTTLSSVTDSYGTVNGRWVQESRNAHSGTKSAGFEGTQRTSALLSTPAINLDPTREYHVSFWLMQSTSTWNDDEVNVYVGRNPESKSGATRLAHYIIYNVNNPRNGMTFFDVDLPAGLSGEYYVMFEAIDVSNGYIYLDDVTVDIYPPCRNLTSQVEVVATTSTTVSVTMPVGARTQIKYGIAPYSASAQPSQIVATVTTADGNATFTGLTAGTGYSIFARGYCADGDSTDWTAPKTVTTKADDCFAPENVRVEGSVSDVEATISWNVVPDVTQYECVLIGGAMNDTMTVTETSVTYSQLTPLSSYMMMVRGLCGENDTTGWTTLNFSTLQTPATVPYSTGFEPMDDNRSWQSLPSGYQSNFIIGRDADGHSSGTRGLYISSDGQSYGQLAPTNPTPQYGVNLYGVAYYSRTIHFARAGNYEVSFDWKCAPRAGLSYEAYGRAFLSPATEILPVDNSLYMRNLPEGSYALENNMDNSRTWQRSSTIVSIDEPQYLNLVFMWFAQNTNGYCSPDDVSDVPLAIDNVMVNEVTCLPVSSVVALSVYDTVATIVVQTPDSVGVEYAVMTEYSLDSLEVRTSSGTTLRDTVVLTGLQPMTEYYFVARQRCSAEDSSSWRVLNFSTTATPAVTPYVCDFENGAENGNWQYTQEGQPNYFVIGAGTSYGGSHSLYITDDGSTYNYDNTALSFGYAHRIIRLSEGLYEYSYDWMCNGEDRDDGARMFLIPADALLFSGSWLYGLSWASVPKNAIALDGGFMWNSMAYNNHSGSFTIENEGLYNIVVAWRSGTNGGANPPLSIDNLTISEVTCIPPTVSVIDAEMGESEGSFAIANVNEGASLEYAVSTSADTADIFSRDTIAYRAEDSVTVQGLSASSTYWLFARSLCSDEDVSFWTSVRFKTLCGEITQFPYTEGFENVTATNGYVRNAASAFCWSSINAASAKPYYNVTKAQHYEGANSLRMTSSSTSALYMLLPEIADLNSLYVTFESMYDNTDAGAGTLSIGYLTDGTDGSTFVSVEDIARTTNWDSQSVIFTNVPSGARMAFRYSGATATTYSVFVDNVRVSRLVTGDVYDDIVCYNANYTRHGFNIPNASISMGANVFTRIAPGVDGASDTLIVANVNRLDNISIVTEDTICEGEAYVKGMWNLPRPMTRTYRNTFRGASVCGCDSTVELHLVVIPVVNVIVDTVCHNGSYVFGDTIIRNPGKYVRTYENQYGCTCSDTLYLMELSDSLFDVATVCQNNLPYVWRGQNINTGGRHVLEITGPRGCAQTAVLDLTVLATDSTVDLTICQGGSVLVVDTIIYDAGSYILNRIDPVGGCMITYHITVTVTPADAVDVYDYVCEGYPYVGNGISGLVVNGDTMVTVTTRTIDAQCDSVTNVHIKFVPTVYKEINETIAAGEIYNFDGNDLTQSGTYHATFATEEYGCDSVVTLNLVVGTGVESVSEVRFDVVPNPINAGATALIYGEIADIDRIEVINSVGQVVQTIEPSTYPIELSGISVSGVYNIRLVAKDGSVYIQKLMVK